VKKTMRALAAMLLAGCASTVSGSDANVDATAVDAMVCVPARTCSHEAAGIPSVSAAVCHPTGGQIGLTVVDPQLRFCNCLHGFGPGIDGYVRFRVVNPTAAPIQIGLTPTLALTSVEDGRPLELGSCCTVQVYREYRCFEEAGGGAWTGRVQPGRTEVPQVNVHLDTPENRPGRYRGTLTFTIDGAPHTLDLGEFPVVMAPGP